MDRRSLKLLGTQQVTGTGKIPNFNFPVDGCEFPNRTVFLQKQGGGVHTRTRDENGAPGNHRDIELSAFRGLPVV